MGPGPDPLEWRRWSLRYLCFDWPICLEIYSKYCIMFKLAKDKTRRVMRTKKHAYMILFP